MHTYHKHAHIDKYMDAHTYTHMHRYTCIPYVHAYTPMHNTHVHIYILTHIGVHRYTYIPFRHHTQRYTGIHTHTHTYTYMHPLICP